VQSPHSCCSDGIIFNSSSRGLSRERSWLVPTLSQSGPPGIRARHGSEDSVVASVLGTDALHPRLRARCSHVDPSGTCAEERGHE